MVSYARRRLALAGPSVCKVTYSALFALQNVSALGKPASKPPRLTCSETVSAQYKAVAFRALEKVARSRAGLAWPPDHPSPAPAVAERAGSSPASASHAVHGALIEDLSRKGG